MPELTERLENAAATVLAAVTPAVDAEDRAVVDDLLACYQVVPVTSDPAARSAVYQLLADAGDGPVALDTETMVLPEHRAPVPVSINKDGSIAKRQPKDGAAGAALDPRRARVRLLQAYAGGRSIYVFDMLAVGWDAVAPLLERETAMFNAVFDIKMILASGGPEPAGRVFDTMTAMRLLGPCESWPISMAEAAALLLETRVPKGLGASDWSGEFTDDQVRYAAVDALITHRLWQAQREEFDATDENSQRITDECLLDVARMELAGMPVDAAKHREFIALWEEELAAAEAALREATGDRLHGADTDAEVRSYLEHVLTDEQLETWPRTGKTGALAANQNAFKRHGEGVRGLTELIAVKRFRKGLSTYGEGLLARVDDGRVYARFLVAAASTGRFSSREPNLQNIPKRSALFAAFRQIFRASPGHKILAADYGQIELREMAEQSGDETMLADFEAGGDPHASMARQLDPDYDSREPEEQKRARNKAKAANFGLIYGSGPPGFATYAHTAFGIPMTEDEAKDIITVWRETYPGIAAWQQNQKWQTRQAGFVTTLGGRRWFWEWRARDWDDPRLDEVEDFRVDDFITGFSYPYACNHPIQGTCAEVMQLALARLDRRLRPFPARILATVHDEIVLEVREDQVAVVEPVVVEAMTGAWHDFHPGAPTKGLVDVAAADTWAEAH
jgi:DNA polymerase I-like protein with 3'-5' exonuclease and polymerase domains